MFDRPRSKRDHVHREGSGVPQNGGNRPPTVETGVLLIGRGVAYCKMEETDLCWSATVETGVLFIGRGVAYHKTGLHGILFISTVDPLQPPRATVHPPSTSSSLHRVLLHRLLFNHPSTVYCSSSPPHHGVLFNHPSMGTPPPSTVHPALHTTGSCSTTPPWAPIYSLLFIQPSTPWGPVHPEAKPPLTVHPKPPTTFTVHPRGSIDRLQLAPVAKESLDWVQLTAIDRSLGFSNA